MWALVSHWNVIASARLCAASLFVLIHMILLPKYIKQPRSSAPLIRVWFKSRLKSSEARSFRSRRADSPRSRIGGASKVRTNQYDVFLGYPFGVWTRSACMPNRAAMKVTTTLCTRYRVAVVVVSCSVSRRCVSSWGGQPAAVSSSRALLCRLRPDWSVDTRDSGPSVPPVSPVTRCAHVIIEEDTISSLMLHGGMSFNYPFPNI